MASSDRYPRPGRERLPFETDDPGDGLYLHDRDGLIRITEEATDAPDRFYLPVERFMDIQRERDELRKTLAVINAHVTPRRETEASPICDRQIITLLRNAGFSADDGRAMRSLVASFYRREDHTKEGES